MTKGTAAAIAGILLAGALPAGAAPVQYAIGKITVKNGNPIRNIGPVIFEQSFGPGCSLPPPSQVKPLSTSLLTSTGLEIMVISCPADSPKPPSVQCRLEVGGLVTQHHFRGWQQVFPILSPDLTGIYPLTLSCHLNGKDHTPLTATLYLTYARPTGGVTAVQPPKEIWYQRACGWAAGISARAPEAEILRRIQQGMYSHGQRNWRYGYCKPDPGKGVCVFGTTEVKPMDVVCSGPFGAKSTICKCRWQTLVEGTPCNFANCFTFSEVLQYLSGVMGVGGLAARDPVGAQRKGFNTQPPLRSFDPRFPGNLVCDPGGLACSYAFDIHSLRSFDHLLYDSTFGQIYTDLFGLIDQSVQKIKSGNLKFHSFRACYKGQGYGQWPFYQEIPLDEDCPKDESPKDGSQPAFFTGSPPRIEGVSITGNDRPELLAVDLEVEIRREGSYAVQANLLADGRPLPPANEFAEADFPEGLVEGPPGHQPLRLFFSGESLAQASSKGPFILQAALISEAGIADTLKLPLSIPEDLLASFGELPAQFGSYTEVRGTLVSEPGAGVYLIVEAPLDVREQEVFILEGRLAHSGKTVAYVSQTINKPERGRSHVRIDFASEGVTRRGFDGFYEVTLVLHRAEPLSFLDSVQSLIELSREAEGEVPP